MERAGRRKYDAQERKGSYISGGPPPREVVGLFKVIHKNDISSGFGSVVLTGENGTCVFRIAAEDANYYVVGEQYLITATKPGS